MIAVAIQTFRNGAPLLLPPAADRALADIQTIAEDHAGNEAELR
jgi:hypothetical protein